MTELSLTEEKLCDLCSKFDLRRALKTGKETLELGHIEDVSKRTTCPLCHLVTLLVHPDWIKEKFACRATPTAIDDASVGSCHLRFDGTDITVVVPLPAMPTGAGPGKALAKRATLLAQDAPLLGVDSSRGALLLKDKIDLDLVRSWLQDCTEHHGLCGGKHEWLRGLPSDFRVIDVYQERVVLADPDCRYIALSYVWGKCYPLMLKKSNHEKLETEGALGESAENISKVVRDAMSLVRGIGERFLWVDSLCIVQDDSESKMKQITRMNTIYYGAHMTIVTLAVKDAADALPGVGDTLRSKTQSIVTLDGLRFLVSHSKNSGINQHVSSAIEDSVWATRGWTYQEERLSRRKLYVGHDQVFFRCSMRGRLESGTGETVSFGGSFNQSLEMKNGGVANPKRRFDSLFEEYVDQVSEYSARGFSHTSDVLDAFAGLAAVWQDVAGWEVMEAVPEPALAHALLWYPVQLCRRRVASAADGSPSAHFASWSWAGWIGKVLVDNARECRRLEHISMRIVPQPLPRLSAVPVNTLEIRSTVAVLRVSTERVLLLGQPESQYISISLGMYDSLGRHCGVVRGLYVPFVEKIEKQQEYECLLLSRDMTFSMNNLNNPHIPGQWVDLEPGEKAAQLLRFIETDGESILGEPVCEYDPETFSRKDWKALNVLLLEKNGEFYERVALGFVHEDAWNAVSPREKTVCLI